MAEALTSPLPPRIVAAQRQLDTALDALNYAATELRTLRYPQTDYVCVGDDYPTACEHLCTAQHAAKAAYRALAAGPERSEG